MFPAKALCRSQKVPTSGGTHAGGAPAGTSSRNAGPTSRNPPRRGPMPTPGGKRLLLSPRHQLAFHRPNLNPLAAFAMASTSCPPCPRPACRRPAAILAVFIARQVSRLRLTVESQHASNVCSSSAHVVDLAPRSRSPIPSGPGAGCCCCRNSNPLAPRREARPPATPRGSAPAQSAAWS